MHTFRRTLDFDYGRVESANYTRLTFQEETHLPCPG